jgi:hypothetical protein
LSRVHAPWHRSGCRAAAFVQCGSRHRRSNTR